MWNQPQCSLFLPLLLNFSLKISIQYNNFCIPSPQDAHLFNLLLLMCCTKRLTKIFPNWCLLVRTINTFNMIHVSNQQATTYMAVSRKKKYLLGTIFMNYDLLCTQNSNTIHDKISNDTTNITTHFIFIIFKFY